MTNFPDEDPYPDNPKLSIAWHAGWKAQKNDEPLPDEALNPSTDTEEAWLGGYTAASEDEIPPNQ